MHQWENSKLIQVEGTKKDGGQQKIILIKVVKNDMLIKNITKSMILDRIKWYKRIHVTGSNYFVENP